MLLCLKYLHAVISWALPAFNNKSLCGPFAEKASVLLLEFRPSDEDVKFGDILSAFRKRKLMPASDFSSTLLHLTFTTGTLHHYTINK